MPWLAVPVLIIGPYLAYGLLGGMIDLVASAILTIGALAALMARRWTAFFTGLALQVLAIAVLVMTWGFMLGVRPKEAGRPLVQSLVQLGIQPSVFLLVVLAAYHLLTFGVRFGNANGRHTPRAGRVISYLGAVIVVTAGLTLFASTEPATPGGDAVFVTWARTATSGVSTWGMAFVGVPLLAWTAWKRADRLLWDREGSRTGRPHAPDSAIGIARTSDPSPLRLGQRPLQEQAVEALTARTPS